MLQESRSTRIEDGEAKLHDDLEELPFFDASDSFEFEASQPVSTPSSESELDDNNDGAISKQSFPLPAGLRRRHLFHRKSSKELPCSPFKNAADDGSVDFDLHGSAMGKKYKLLWNLKDNERSNQKQNLTKGRVSCGGDERVSDRRVGSSILLFSLAELVIKAIAFQTDLLIGFVTFPIWLTYSSYMFLIDPFAIMRRGKSYMKRSICRLLRFWYGNVKWIVRRNRSTWKLCLQIGRGLLWSGMVGMMLVGLLVMGFVISGVIMKCILEEPMQKIEQLSFDYTRDAPMALVPLMECHKLQATVSLTLPESDYNRNLGMFQVRVDFLSGSGKPLVSRAQPCMLRFRSKPIRLLVTLFKLAPLITGYASESQTLNVRFSGHRVPTCCLRVSMEPRANGNGGVPQIYAAHVKVESQLPVLKRLLWSWKATVFVWTGIVMFTVGLVLILSMVCWRLHNSLPR